MSRLRARTWTAQERWIMWLWRLWYVDTSGHNEKDLEWVNSEVGGYLPDLAERIMRTKGTRGGWRILQYPHAPLLETIWYARYARVHRDSPRIWQPSDFNPNIYVRREA